MKYKCNLIIQNSISPLENKFPKLLGCQNLQARPHCALRIEKQTLYFWSSEFRGETEMIQQLKTFFDNSDQKLMVFHSFKKDSKELEFLINTRFEFETENTLRFEPISAPVGAWSNNALWVYLEDFFITAGKTQFQTPPGITYDLFFNPLSWELDDKQLDDLSKLQRLLTEPTEPSHSDLYQRTLILPPRPMENDRTQEYELDIYGNLCQNLRQQVRSQFTNSSDLPAWCHMVDIMQNSIIWDALREGAHFSFERVGEPLHGCTRRFQLAVPGAENQSPLVADFRTKFLATALKFSVSATNKASWQDHLRSALVADIKEYFHPENPLRKRKNLNLETFKSVRTVNPRLLFGAKAIDRSIELNGHTQLLENAEQQVKKRGSTPQDQENLTTAQNQKSDFVRQLKDKITQSLPNVITSHIKENLFLPWLADDEPEKPYLGLVAVLGWAAIWPYFDQTQPNEPLDSLGLPNTFPAFIKALDQAKKGADIKNNLEEFLKASLLVAPEKRHIFEKEDKLYIALAYLNLPRVQPLLHLLSPLNTSIFPGGVLDVEYGKTEEELEDEAIAPIKYGLGYLL